MKKLFALFPAVFLLVALGCVRKGSRVSVSPLQVVDQESGRKAGGERKIRVGLRIQVDKASVSCDGKILARDGVRDVNEEWDAGKYMISAKGKSLLVEGRKYGQWLRLSPGSSSKPLQSNSMRVHGTLLVKAANSKVTVINTLLADDYLKGVLPREVVPTWHVEALKAQAVASRSYLMSHLGRHQAEGFDLCAEVHCQVYGGITREDARTSRAVDLTKGEILTYKGQPIKAFFHSNCGGRTEKVKAVWGSPDKPYLPCKKCIYGKKDPRYHWSLKLKKEEILSALKKNTKVRGKYLYSLRIERKSPSGRVHTISVKTELRRYALSGNDFRMAIGPEKIRSTLWTYFGKTKDGYRFKGRGWGHGVGLCQWGTWGLADRGYPYRKILKFYYPNTKLERW